MRSVIMCVDDDKYMLHALSEQLNEWFGKDYIIEKALSGEEALLIIDEYLEKRISISVVISDYIMPVMRGDTFLEKVHEKDPAIKTIMLTGYSALEGVIYAINKAGLYHFVGKPWDNKDLMLTILEAIKSYEQSQTMTRLYEDFKSFYSQFDEKIKYLKTGFDTAFSTLIGETENIIDKSRDNSTTTHSLAVKYYASELAKALTLDKDAQSDAGMVALLHEIGKYGLAVSELDALSKARRDIDYSSPVLTKLLDRTVTLAKGFGGNYAEVLSQQYKMYDPGLPQLTRILAVANMFDNLVLISDSVTAAQGSLLKYAYNKYLDLEMVKAFIKNVPVYSGE